LVFKQYVNYTLIYIREELKIHNYNYNIRKTKLEPPILKSHTLTQLTLLKAQGVKSAID